MTIVCVLGSRVIKFDEHVCSRVCLHLLELLTAQKSEGRCSVLTQSCGICWVSAML